METKVRLVYSVQMLADVLQKIKQVSEIISRRTQIYLGLVFYHVSWRRTSTLDVL